MSQTTIKTVGQDINRNDVLAVRVGRKWAAVTHYTPKYPLANRSGYWCEDATGGWGQHSSSAAAAVDACTQPKTYPTLAALVDVEVA